MFLGGQICFVHDNKREEKVVYNKSEHYHIKKSEKRVHFEVFIHTDLHCMHFMF
jgi:hypothetical protein